MNLARSFWMGHECGWVRIEFSPKLAEKLQTVVREMEYAGIHRSSLLGGHSGLWWGDDEERKQLGNCFWWTRQLF